MKQNLMTVQEVIDLLSKVDDQSLPALIYCDGDDTTYAFQRGERGIAFDSFEDENEVKHPAAYLLVLRCNNEP